MDKSLLNAVEEDRGQTGSVMEIRDGILVIRVAGELDHHNSVFIRREADEVICRMEIVNLIFDFERTTFMDSSGIGVIMGRYKKIKPFGGKIGVIHAGSNVEKILLYSGLNKIVTHYQGLEEALTEMSSKSVN